MKTIACVLKTGGQYDWTWVERLARGVRAYMGGPYRFVCLTDDFPHVAEGVRTIPLRHGWPGWWSKLELFRPGLFQGPVLYLDLDSLIVGPLEPLFREEFTMVRDFAGGNRGWCNSSVMAWHGDVPGPYEAFTAGADIVRGGDQEFIQAHTSPAVFGPGLVVSYKIDAMDGPPAGASVVCFHGSPKPAEAGGWAADAYAD